MKFLKLLLSVYFVFGLGQIAYSQISEDCDPNGTITTFGGLTEVQIGCSGDGSTDIIRFKTNTFPLPFALTVTDESNTIILIKIGTGIDFEELGPGNYRVYAMYFLGQILAEPGDNLLDVKFATICHAPSQNFVSIGSSATEPGTVSTTDGATSVVICTGDGNPNEVAFASTSTEDMHVFLVTDEAGNILAISEDGVVDFESNPIGVCRVWGLSFGETLTAQVGDNINDGNLANRCFALSNNFVEVVRTVPDGGTVSLTNGNTSDINCIGASNNELSFSNTTSSTAPYTFLLTNEDNIIIEVLNNNAFDFDNLEPGTYRIWGLSFTGSLTAVAGQDAALAMLSDDCFELSTNFIEITRRNVHGAMVSLADGSTSTFACVNDGEADELSIINNSTSNENYIYIVTDENNLFITVSENGVVDFESVGVGVCRIWGLSFFGNLNLQAGDDITAINLSDDCFDLSDNFVEVTRKEVDGGTVSLDNGQTDITICVSDDIPNELSFVSTSTSNESFLFVITDENNNLITTSENGVVDFDGAGPGICRVWGLSFSGNLTAPAETDLSTIALSDECFELSSNFVEVRRKEVNGGMVSIDNGETSATVCVGDQVADELSFINTSTANENYIYVITDENNNIITTSEGTVDFDGTGSGICRVWGLSFSGNLIVGSGDNAVLTTLSDECFELSSNFVEVTRKEVDGGTLSLDTGETAVAICVNDGISDVLNVSTNSTSSEGYIFIITDESNTILATSESGSIDLDNVGVGVCRIWGLSFSGTLLAAVNDNAAEGSLSDECFELSTNFIEVTREAVQGGMVSLNNGEDSASVCIGDGTADTLSFSSTGVGENIIFVITDENNNIIDTSANGTIDFENAGSGICRVWSLAYSGNLTAGSGDNAAITILADECFALSTNFVEVIRIVNNGGVLGGETFSVCSGDGVDDLFDINTTGVGESYTFLLTDENNIILAFSEDGNFQFEGVQTGICRIWGLAYSGNLLAMIGDDAAAIDLSDGCFDLSDDFVTINRTFVDGGTVSIEGGGLTASICANDGVSDEITFDFESTSDESFAFIITDENNNIITVLEGNSIDFDRVVPGICRVWGVSFSGQLTSEIDVDLNSIPLSDGCFDLSLNFVEVIRVSVDGGTVSLEGGGNTIFTCPRDGNPDVVRFDSTTNASASYAYIITDENNIILDVKEEDSNDFDGVSPGTCRVWGLAYTGDLIVFPGSDASTATFSNQCFDLSDNFIEVIRQIPEGGTVALTNGETNIFTCPGDGNADVVEYNSTGASTGAYTYLVTDENNVILAVVDDNQFDFDAVPPGICHIWGLAYTGNLTAAIDSNAAAISLSDDCFDLSDNFITVDRESPEGGLVSTILGDNSIAICPGDGRPNIIEFENTATSRGEYAFIVTDEDNLIIAVLAGNSVDFEPTPAAICRVWGVAYTGNLIVNIGENAAEVPLSDDCFDLSDNFVEVVREVPIGGFITNENGATEIEICVGDEFPDIITFAVEDQSPNTSYAYIITDENGFILSPIVENNFDFNNAIGGICHIYGIAYTGTLSVPIGSDISQTTLSDDCFDLSVNFIEVTRTQVDGGILFTDPRQDTTFICPDGVDDIVTFNNSSTATDANYQYVLTTSNNSVLSPINGDQFNFDNVGISEVRVWGISFTGDLELLLGRIITDVPLSNDCYDLSENFLTFISAEPDGGTVSYASGATDSLLCIGAIEGIIEFANTSVSNAGYEYLITDNNNIIVGVSSDGSSFDFNTLPPGNYRIWGLSYTGNLQAEPGLDAASATLASTCFELSSGFVTAEVATPVDGGEISTITGDSVIYTCPGDEIGDLIVLMTNSLDTGYQFIITDTNNLVIVSDVEDNVVDFDAAAPGVCRIWGLSFNGDFSVGFGTNILEDDLSTACFEISSNFITVVREVPEGGTVSTADGETSVSIVVGDGNQDIITFDRTGTSSSKYTYVITDENNEILGIPNGNQADFEGAGTGICRVWGLAYTGEIIATIGDTASLVALSDDCFDLSDNFITINRLEEGVRQRSNIQIEGLSNGTSQQGFQISLSPNPASNQISISFNIDEVIRPKNSLQVFNASGQMILQQTIGLVKGNNQLELDINLLNNGLYTIILTNGHKVARSRFVKQ